MIAGNQPRCAGTDAVTLHRIDGRRDDLRILTEIEVIVAGERQQATPVAFDPNSRSRGDRRRAAKLRAFQRGELVGGKFF